MTNSLKKQTQGEVMNIPPGIDRREATDGTVTYRVRIRIKGSKPISKTFKNLTHAKQWQRTTEAQVEKGLYLSYAEAEQHTLAQAIDRYDKEVLYRKPKDARNVARHLACWKKELGHLKLSRLNPPCYCRSTRSDAIRSSAWSKEAIEFYCLQVPGFSLPCIKYSRKRVAMAHRKSMS
ncbi:MAG TPA: hypothetical protein VIH61_00170 [Waddliaceae bacterium]